jgi:hypothetical protein
MNSTINQKDSQGRKQGYWEDIGTRMILNLRGDYIEKGDYVDNLREGVWETWTTKDNGLWMKEQVLLKTFYKNDLPLGVQEKYNTKTGELEELSSIRVEFNRILERNELITHRLPPELVTAWSLLQAALGRSHFSLW